MDILSYILGKKAGGGGGEAVLVNKDISANGTYNASADSADGYKKVVVDVPNSYAAGDEGKVVDNGALVSQTSATYTSNDTYDTTKVNSVTVDVPMPDMTIYGHDGANNYTFYLADMVLTGDISLPQTQQMVNRRITMFNDCANLKSFIWETTGQLGGSTGNSMVAFFKNCTALEHISFPYTTGFPTAGWVEDIILGCESIKDFTVGSVGHPNTLGMGPQSGNYQLFRDIAYTFDVIIYANANSLADVPAVLKTGSPWGAVNANIIYRSSVTGEVLT